MGEWQVAEELMTDYERGLADGIAQREALATEALATIGPLAAEVARLREALREIARHNHHPVRYDEHIAAIARVALASAPETAPSREDLAPVQQYIDALERALDPRHWSPAMSKAWHEALPDTHKAFRALRATAIKESAP
jgi:hypothetical protein